MEKLFGSVWFNGHDLLMSPDNGGNAAGGQGGAGGQEQDKDAEDDQGDDSGEDGEDGDGEDSDADDEGEDDDSDDDLDAPQYSKRDVSKIVTGRLTDFKKQYKDHPVLVEAVKMIGEIMGTTDTKTIHERLQTLYAQHQAKIMGMTPQGYQYTQQQQQQTTDHIKDAKRRGIESEFDNSFVKNKEFTDATLFRDQIIDLTENGLTMTQAYWAAMGELKSNKKADAAAKNAQQLAAHKASTKKSKRVTGGETGAQGGGKPKIPAEVEAAAKKLGMDPEEYHAWMSVENIDQARALRGKK